MDVLVFCDYVTATYHFPNWLLASKVNVKAGRKLQITSCGCSFNEPHSPHLMTPTGTAATADSKHLVT